ncbi:MAG: DUF4239 domain-containing protein [Bradyrhizobiaceae bacterium]|nr:MAG: DUF4239 domain-containing protein [Bradyrhizobiaceae bacterium]
MSGIAISVIVFLCIAAGTAAGMLLRRSLAEHHLSNDAKDVVRLGTGLIGTIAALVLGLLIGSAKTSFDLQTSQVRQITANVALVDLILAEYGAEARNVRLLLRQGVAVMADRLWHEKDPTSARPAHFEASAAGDRFYLALQSLPANDDIHRSLQARAMQISTDVAQIRLLLFTQPTSSIPMPFLVVLIFWLAVIFASFSLFAKPTPIVICSLFLFALSATGAIYLVFELGQPFSGLMRIPPEPLREALAPLPG